MREIKSNIEESGLPRRTAEEKPRLTRNPFALLFIDFMIFGRTRFWSIMSVKAFCFIFMEHLILWNFWQLRHRWKEFMNCAGASFLLFFGCAPSPKVESFQKEGTRKRRRTRQKKAKGEPCRIGERRESSMWRRKSSSEYNLQDS